MKPTVCAAKRMLERCPSQIWYLMLDSEVSPTRGKSDEPLVTGKKRNAQQMFPMYPSLSDTLRNLASHLPKKKRIWSSTIIYRYHKTIYWASSGKRNLKLHRSAYWNYQWYIYRNCYCKWFKFRKRLERWRGCKPTNLNHIKRSTQVYRTSIQA